MGYLYRIADAELRESDLLIVLTGGSFTYTRPDGVKVIFLAWFKTTSKNI